MGYSFTEKEPENPKKQSMNFLQCAAVLEATGEAHIKFEEAKQIAVYYKEGLKLGFISLPEELTSNSLVFAGTLAAGAVKYDADSVVWVAKQMGVITHLAEKIQAIQIKKEREFLPGEVKTNFIISHGFSFSDGSIEATGYSYTGGEGTGKPVEITNKGHAPAPFGIKKFLAKVLEFYEQFKGKTAEIKKPQRSLSEIPTEELQRGLSESLKDAIVCKLALGLGVEGIDPAQIKERLEVNDRIIALIEKELDRRVGKENGLST